VLLKSFAVVVPLGVLVGAALLARERRFSPREVAVAAAVALGIVAGWVLLRYLADGGRFFSLMVGSDLVGRATHAVEGHARPWYWYIARLFQRSPVWMVLLVVAVAAAYRHRTLLARTSYSDMLIASWVVVPLVVATGMQTKLAWYVNPVYPALALVLARLLRAFPVHAMLVVVLAGALVSEAIVVRKIVEARVLPPHERRLLALELPPGSDVYALEWSQAAYFVARVERGYVPRTQPPSQ
jgi:4-amino-4-deoxy-L-arabinose transferase-like glycosyltransferase